MNKTLQKCPKLRFTDTNGQSFPDWEEKQLGEVAKIQTGKTPSTHDPNLWHDELMFVTPTDIHDNILFQEKTMRRITKTDAIQIVPKGSILYTCIASIGKISIAHYECATNQQINAILPRTNEVNNIFIYYLLVYQTPRIKRLSANTTLPIINKNDFSKIKINISHPDEQQKIADALSSVDAKISALRRKRDLLKEYKRGLMQKLFDRTLRFTDDNGQPFPDWEEKRLREVFDWIKTNNLSRENLTYEKNHSQIQNIHYGDIHTKFKKLFDQNKESIPYIATHSVITKFSDDEFCRKGDVVIADASEDYNDVGKAIEIINVCKNSLVAGLHTYVARPKKNLLIVGFSGYLLSSYTIRRQIMRMAQGISVLGVSKNNLSKVTLLLPHPDEQKKIADALSAIDAKISAVSDQIEKFEKFKKGLLQQMFV